MQREPSERDTVYLNLHMQKAEMETKPLAYLSVQLLFSRGKHTSIQIFLYLIISPLSL